MRKNPTIESSPQPQQQPSRSTPSNKPSATKREVLEEGGDTEEINFIEDLLRNTQEAWNRGRTSPQEERDPTPADEERKEDGVYSCILKIQFFPSSKS